MGARSLEGAIENGVAVLRATAPADEVNRFGQMIRGAYAARLLVVLAPAEGSVKNEFKRILYKVKIKMKIKMKNRQCDKLLIRSISELVKRILERIMIWHQLDCRIDAIIEP